MTKYKNMKAADIKQHVIRVEGFELEFQCSPMKQFAVALRARRTPGATTVSKWISDTFGDKQEKVFVLRAGQQIVKRMTLGRVRATYPSDFRNLAKRTGTAETKAAKATDALSASKRKFRQVKTAIKDVVQQVNSVRRDAENRAAHDALEKALRKADRYHVHVVEFCKNILTEPVGTQLLIEGLLARWTRREKEIERLNGILAMPRRPSDPEHD